jgi:hypothetical protein
MSLNKQEEKHKYNRVITKKKKKSLIMQKLEMVAFYDVIMT